MSLLKLLDRPITFHRVFVDLTGSINAAGITLPANAVRTTRFVAGLITELNGL